MKKLLTIIILFCTFIPTWAQEEEWDDPFESGTYGKGERLSWYDSNGVEWYFYENGVISGCSQRTSELVIPAKVYLGNDPVPIYAVDMEAFACNTDLTSVTISEGISTIYWGAFCDCANLTSIYMPSTMGRIDDYVFSQCTKLSNIYCYSKTAGHFTWHEYDDDYYDDVFSNYKATVHVPYGCVEAYRNASIWEDFDKIVEIPSTGPLVEIDGINYNIANKKAYVTKCNPSFSGSLGIYPSVTYNGVTYNLTAVCREAFKGCADITSATLPEGVTSIETSAFEGCTSLASVSLPSTISKIDNKAFNLCPNLTMVYCFCPTPAKINYYTFSNRKNATLIVPTGSAEAYQAANYWKEFKEITEMDTDESVIIFADDKVKEICLANWDANGDGWLSTTEAAAVSDLGTVFQNRTDITSFDELHYFTGLSDIWPSTFSGCTNLKTLMLPTGVTCIRESVFSGMSGLTRVTIPESVTSIMPSAFAGCSGLAFATIPSGVTSIGAAAFAGCSGVKTLTIPSSVTTIADGAFLNCTGLTTVTVYPAEAEWSATAFSGCTNIKSVKVPVIDLAAFCNNQVVGLIYATINKPVQLLDNDGVEIVKYTIPSSVASIGDHAFHNCTGLTFVKIPYEVKSIGASVFEGCSGMTSYNIYTYGGGVKSIGPLAFAGCTALTKGSIPAGIATIPDGLFQNCSSMESVNIPSVAAIGSSAFSGCSSLTKTTIPLSVTNIGQEAFKNCSLLTTITIPLNVAEIGPDAFSGCSGMTSVYCNVETPLDISQNTFTNRANAILYVPDGCVEAYQAADYWKDFMEINVNDPAISFYDSNTQAVCVEKWDSNKDGRLGMSEAAAVTTLGSVFHGNRSVTYFDELVYFTGLTSIWSSSFSGCVNLRSVQIPKNVTYVGSKVFDNTYLYNNAPNGIFYVDRWACGYKGELPNAITLKEGTRGISESLFKARTTLTSVSIPESVKYICDYAFYCCYNLSSATIPSNVVSIGSYAFFSCSNLSNVIIPSTVTSIGNYAFYGCSNLTSVYCNRREPLSIESKVFYNPSKATLYVPEGSREAYMAAPYWKDFGNIIEINPVLPEPDVLDPDEPDTDYSAIDNTLYLEPVEGMEGGQALLSVKMKNKAEISSFQFNLRLPEGVTVATDADGLPMAEMSEERTTRQKTDYFDVVLQDDGSLQVLCTTSAEDPDTGHPYVFSGNDGEVARVRVNIADNLSTGDYPVILKKVSTSTFEHVAYYTDHLKSTLSVTNSATGINNTILDSSQAGESAIYHTLDGRKLIHKPTRKGVYIVNGKKRVVK